MCPSRMHYVLSYIRYGLQRRIETKARVGSSRKEEIVVKNKKRLFKDPVYRMDYNANPTR